MSPTYLLYLVQTKCNHPPSFQDFPPLPFIFEDSAFEDDDDDTDMFKGNIFIDSCLEYFPSRGDHIAYEMVKSLLHHFQKLLFDCSFKNAVPPTFLSPTRDCTGF